MQVRAWSLGVLLAVGWTGLRCGGLTPGRPPGGDAGTVDAGEPIVASPGSWSWIPVEGSQCASGSTAGIGVNLTEGSEDLFIYLEGGGACWNQGTCVPSLLRYGPLCDYGTFCPLDTPGGTQPTAVHVTEGDPYPRDGGGAFPAALQLFKGTRAFDREDPANPFRGADYAFIPYCTGDLHAGNATSTYSYKYNLFDSPKDYTVHFKGAGNMELYLQRLRATRPNVKRIWLTGSSAGGYGATFNLERVKRAFPAAQVHLLADCSPFIQPVHWERWQEAWALELPQGCADCDAGMPQVMGHLARSNPTSRVGLMAYDQDRVIAWFFLAPQGAAGGLNPPLGAYGNALGKLVESYDGQANSRYFIAPGDTHVLWGAYGTKGADGGYSASPRSRDGGTDLKAFVDGWATGGPGWTSSR